MGDRLLAGKLSQYVTSHRGQLSLAIPPWVGAMSTSLGWEGNRRSGVALAMHHIVIYPPTGSTAYERKMSTPPTLLLEYGPPLPFFTAAGIHFHSLEQEAINRSSFCRQTFQAYSTPDIAFSTQAIRNNLHGNHALCIYTGIQLCK